MCLCCVVYLFGEVFIGKDFRFSKFLDNVKIE